jgi:hypothetical protein
MVGIPKTKRGGGPKTEAGKLASSGNAMRSGAYSNQVTILGESQEDFQKLFDEFVTSLRPEGGIEQSLVYELAFITWKKLRLDKVERDALSSALTKPVKATDIRQTLWLGSEHDWILADLPVLTKDFVFEMNRYLAFIIGLGDYGIAKDDFYQLPNTHPSLFLLVRDMILEDLPYIDTQDAAPEQLIRLSKVHEDGTSEAYVHWTMRQIMYRAEQVNTVYAQLDEIEAAIQRVKQNRLLELMQAPGIIRARDDLGRAFSRGLSELRKQQLWRLKMTAIDVTPEE